MSRYARGKRALGICDRCARTYRLDELKYEVENGEQNGLRVCPTCLDPDHPQNWHGKVLIEDPQALFDARPDIAKGDGLFGWNPVGHSTTGKVTASVGTVTVVT